MVPSGKVRAAAVLRRLGWGYIPLSGLWRIAERTFWGCLRRAFARSAIFFGPPRGIYSEFTLLEDGKVDGRVILRGQPRPTLKKDSLRVACNFKQDEFQPWPIFWTHRRNARLVGASLVLMDEHKRISIEAAYGLHCLPTEPSYNYFRLPEPVHLSGNWTSLISRWSYGYYHWLTDVLPRLAILSELPSDTQIIVPAEFAPYQIETLRYMGLEKRLRPTPEHHMVVENFFFSSPPAMTGCFNPYGSSFLRKTFLGMADRSFASPKRFYVRRVAKTRGIANESEVIAFFQKLGWTIVDTEKLSMPQQIQLFANAEFICSLHGAAFANLLWCNRGCKVLELVAHNYMNGCYEGLCEELGLIHKYIIFKADSNFVATIDLSRLQSALDM